MAMNYSEILLNNQLNILNFQFIFSTIRLKESHFRRRCQNVCYCKRNCPSPSSFTGCGLDGTQ
ncbi:hypothetical protein SUBVAR_04058 [Subdoligranulum variabile DSM 15176]|uniref:Uncharacterized protein n=1 Tax=Subdoligranulum variabile DSM 15176 TaxID=411471 RepID=D1PI93_9FIRM|nr:hypothetical protein SUBVAR_04058 [Subdoligranulum variabile DSM 15176]